MYHSKSVTSNQTGVHPRLRYVVQRHLDHPYLKPFQSHNLKAFDVLLNVLASEQYESLILDSCCGTGLSSFTLAKKNPESLIVGVDQSFVRLNKDKRVDKTPKNCLMLQANCEDIWRLCDYAGIHFKEHYILYPNPYPKSEHLQRRWHAHPSFPVLKNLADLTVLRSNWRTYLDEFSVAWQCLTQHSFAVNALPIGGVLKEPLTLFERKYSQSGQALFELKVQLAK